MERPVPRETMTADGRGGQDEGDDAAGACADAAPPEDAVHMPQPLARLVVLCVLICVVEFWCQRHLGKALKGIVVAAGVPALVGVFAAYVKLFKHDSKALVRAGERAVAMLLGNVCLAGAASFLLAGGSLLSSVAVLADGTEGRKTVTLRVSGRNARDGSSAAPCDVLIGSGDSLTKELVDSDGVIRFFCVTNPFGRSFTLDVAGYVQHSFELSPWIGARVRIGSDLVIAPTVLVRVPPPKQSLLGAGVIELSELPPDGGEPRPLAKAGFVTETPVYVEHGSVLFGFPRSIPSDLLPRWEREMRVDTSHAEGDQKQVDKGVLLWLDPIRCSVPLTLAIGARLRARLLDANEQPHAIVEFTLSSEPFQDVLLHAIGQESTDSDAH